MTGRGRAKGRIENVRRHGHSSLPCAYANSNDGDTSLLILWSVMML